MPKPDHEPPWRIVGGLGDHALWWLVEQRVTVKIACDACGHATRWKPVDLDRRFARRQGKTLGWVGPRLRCSACQARSLTITTIAGSLMSL